MTKRRVTSHNTRSTVRRFAKFLLDTIGSRIRDDKEEGNITQHKVHGSAVRQIFTWHHRFSDQKWHNTRSTVRRFAKFLLDAIGSRIKNDTTQGTPHGFQPSDQVSACASLPWIDPMFTYADYSVYVKMRFRLD